MVDIQNCLNGVPSVCMNVYCDNKCTKMKVIRMGKQKVIQYFCDEHYKQFIEEVCNGLE